MKIVYYFDTDISLQNASIVHVMKMCQAFARCGTDVTLCCNGEVDDLKSVFERYGITDQFDIKLVSMSEFLKRHGHRFGAYYSAWCKARMHPIGSFAYSRSAASLCFLRKKAQYIYEAHIEPDIISRAIEYYVLKHENCKHLVVISEALKRRYLELFPFFPEERITVLHDAADIVDCDDNTDHICLEASEGAVVGYIGSLLPGKCMETILPLAKASPQHWFHIVGGTDYWVDYWKGIAEEQDIHNLTFYGFIDNSKLGAYYKAFDVCILPFSKNIYIDRRKRVDIGRWTSPLKLFEAMAYGKAILVSRLATIEEVMEDGTDCIMAEPDDIVDWTNKLNILIEDKQMQKKIAAEARKKLVKEYTWQERAKRAARLFE